MSTDQPSRRNGDHDRDSLEAVGGEVPAPPPPLPSSPAVAPQQTARGAGPTAGPPPMPPPSAPAPPVPLPPNASAPSMPPPPDGPAPPSGPPGFQSGAAVGTLSDQDGAARPRRKGWLVAAALLVFLAAGGAIGFVIATLGGTSDSSSNVVASEADNSVAGTSETVDVDSGTSNTVVDQSPATSALIRLLETQIPAQPTVRKAGLLKRKPPERSTPLAPWVSLFPTGSLLIFKPKSKTEAR